MVLPPPHLRLGLRWEWSFSAKQKQATLPSPPNLRANPLPSGHKGLTIEYSQVGLSPISLSWVGLSR